jgi:histidinol-phosphate aminotransferase
MADGDAMNQKIELPAGVELPLNLGLNDGIWCSQAALDAMKQFNSRTSLRWYTDPDNDRLREVIAELDGVRRDQVFLRNGSGPILKQVFPHIVKTRIKASPRRVLRHLVNKNGYPIVTGRFTYSKVPKKAAEIGLTIHLLPLGPENGFTFDMKRLEGILERQDSIVYLCNPNNPTGNVLIDKAKVEQLATRFPQSTFWIDEAYVHYLPEEEHERVSPLVATLPNLVVSRTFSFAYGMAGVRIGYLLGSEALVKELNSQLTNYRIGGLQEAMAVASLRDPEHLPFVRENVAKERQKTIAAINAMEGVEAFPSVTNFVLCRFTDGRTGEWLKARLAERQVHIKVLAPFHTERYDPYFRLTMGVPAETDYLLAQIADVLAE